MVHCGTLETVVWMGLGLGVSSATAELSVLYCLILIVYDLLTRLNN